MRRFGGSFGDRRRLFLNAVGFVAVALPIVFVVTNEAPRQSPSQAQSKPVNTSEFKYEVVSIKPFKSRNGEGIVRAVPGAPLPAVQPPDGFTARDITPILLIYTAYGIFEDGGVTGEPNWTTKETFDVDAKMDSNVADALQKLSPDDRKIARQHMLQSLLADRFKLIIHREIKELPIYSLVVAKAGLKLREAKPGYTLANGKKASAGATGIWIVREGVGTDALVGVSVPVDKIAEFLSFQTGRHVLDKTGLTGIYDFRVQFTPDESAPPLPLADAPDGRSVSIPDLSGPLLAAIQQQLGLKLESGRGPVESIFIDHIERPSGN
jgi:uncharacterized protein (TIGR03435 family)